MILKSKKARKLIETRLPGIAPSEVDLILEISDSPHIRAVEFVIILDHASGPLDAMDSLRMQISLNTL
jgi:hypothetical protein